MMSISSFVLMALGLIQLQTEIVTGIPESVTIGTIIFSLGGTIIYLGMYVKSLHEKMQAREKEYQTEVNKLHKDHADKIENMMHETKQIFVDYTVATNGHARLLESVLEKLG